jgi:hypothetical protein
MNFQTRFTNVAANEIAEIVDAFAGGAGTVTVSSMAMRKYEVVTTWSTDMAMGSRSLEALESFLNRKRPREATIDGTNVGLSHGGDILFVQIDGDDVVGLQAENGTVNAYLINPDDAKPIAEPVKIWPVNPGR